MNPTQSDATNDDPGIPPDAVEQPAAVRVEPRSTVWFDRYDLAAFRVLLIAVPIVATIGLIGGPLVDWIRGKPMVAATSGQIQFPDAAINPVPAAHYDSVSATLWLDHPAAGERLIGLIAPLIAAVCLTIAAWLVWRVIDDVRRGFAFSRANVRRMQWLSLVTLAGLLLWNLLPSLLAVPLALSATDSAEPPIELTQSIGPMFVSLLVGFTIAMLSQVFAVGADLADKAAEAI